MNYNVILITQVLIVNIKDVYSIVIFMGIVKMGFVYVIKDTKACIVKINLL